MTIKGMATWCLVALCTLPVAAQKQQFTLDKCIEMALKNNTEVKNARLEVEVADEDRKYAFTQIFPQISAMGAGFVGAKDLMRGQMEVPQMGAMPLSMIKKGVVATLTALQPLYMGGQVINANKMAELQREVRHLEFEMTEKDVIQNVHDYYWQLVALRGNIATLEAAEKQLNEVYGLTKKFVDAGVTTRNDLLRVELKKQETASQRLKLDNGIEVVRLLLAQLCGADMMTFDIEAQNILTPPEPKTFFVQTDQALGNREEIEMTEKVVDLNALQVKMERGKNLPTVAVGAAGLYYNMMEDNQGNLVGLATVSVPISGWWSGSHKIRKAKLALEQSRNKLRDTKDKLAIEIITSWNALEEAYAQIEIARQSVEQANENLRLSRDQYNAGTMDMTELLDAVTLHTQSHATLTSACADYQKRIAEYQRKTR